MGVGMGNWYDSFLLRRLFSYRAVGAGTDGMTILMVLMTI